MSHTPPPTKTAAAKERMHPTLIIAAAVVVILTAWFVVEAFFSPAKPTREGEGPTATSANEERQKTLP
jgi:hypothetical protein